MYISSVTMKNFRCYRSANSTFVHRGQGDKLPRQALKNVTLLVGVNGSGKTSILRAVALGVIAPVIGESGYRPYYLVRRPKSGAPRVETGRIEIKGVLDSRESKTVSRNGSEGASDRLANRVDLARRKDYDIVQFGSIPGFQDWKDPRAIVKAKDSSGPQAFVFNRRTKSAPKAHLQAALEEYYNDFSPSFFLLGYGANRRVEEPTRGAFSSSFKERGRRYNRVAGLFEEGLALASFSAWLPQLRKTNRYKEVMNLLNRTLPAGTRFTGRFLPDQQPLFLHQRVELPFPALSDGYRSYVGLLGDLVCHLNVCCPKDVALTDLTGVVMVDDIDLHLHPQWQRVVVPKLARAFPKLQFILTTHSPLVAGTVHAANVRVIGKNAVYEFAERLHGLSVDQILSSPYFGHTPPRSDESEKHLQALLEGPIEEGDPGPALEFLKELAGENPAKR
jgi:hypothetical protein